MEDLSPGCKRHPDYEIAVSFNILIPNKNAGVMLRHSSSLFYYFLSLFVRLHITIATITRIIPNISPADKVSLYSITPIKVAATGSTDAKIEAFPLSKFLIARAVKHDQSKTDQKNQHSYKSVIKISVLGVSRHFLLTYHSFSFQSLPLIHIKITPYFSLYFPDDSLLYPQQKGKTTFLPK